MVSLLLPILYLIFISLGLPDSLLGSAWPTIYQEFDVPYSYQGFVTVIISLGTVISSLNSDRLPRKFGSSWVTSISILMTAFGLFGFSFSHSIWMLMLAAIPYGLGAGAVDASLNNYIALHYESRHMSWLHCMWGVGASIGPYIMTYALTSGGTWNNGYRYIGYIQVVIALISFLSIPLWTKKAALDRESNGVEETEKTPEMASESKKALSLKQILQIPGAKAIMVTFFCYCAVETLNFNWASTYLQINRGATAEEAASYAAMFYLGMTIGRFFNGFLTMKFSDKQLIHLGESIMAVGLVLELIPGHNITLGLVGLIVLGLGCAPVYPCIINSTPDLFGPEKSQAVIGVQMASAYISGVVVPASFGVIANHITIALFPFANLLMFLGMFLMYQRLLQVSKEN